MELTDYRGKSVSSIKSDIAKYNAPIDKAIKSTEYDPETKKMTITYEDGTVEVQEDKEEYVSEEKPLDQNDQDMIDQALAAVANGEVKDIDESINTEFDKIEEEAKEEDIKIDSASEILQDKEAEKMKETISKSDLDTSIAFAGASEEDMKKLAELAILYESNHDASIYNKMTPFLKAAIKKACVDSGMPTDIETLGIYAKMIVGQLVQNMKIDSEWGKFQAELAKASQFNQIEEYAAIVYDNMFFKTLIKAHTFEYKNLEKEATTCRQVADTYLNCFFFIPLIDVFDGNKPYIRKYEKRFKSSVENIDNALPKLGITVTEAVSVKRSFARLCDSVGEREAKLFIRAFDVVVNRAVLEPNATNKEIAFIIFQYIGVLAMMNKDPETRTEFTKNLVQNFERFVKIAKIKLNIREGRDEVKGEYHGLDKAKLILEITNGKNKLYTDTDQLAKDRFNTDFLPKLDEAIEEAKKKREEEEAKQEEQKEEINNG